MAADAPPAVIIAAGRTPIGAARKGTAANVEASELAKPVCRCARGGMGSAIVIEVE
jgi:acetyl-CoA acetyltransferase